MATMHTAHTMKKPTKAGKKANADKAPIFLRKTYTMIDSCDPSICAWSDEGTTFVVKQPQIFSSKILSQYFKHNNFSSFVRQLNFYGFRKVKNDHLRIRDAAADVESKYWKFRHDKFQRGHPELLVEIRKQKHNDEPDKQDVEGLKKQVKELKSRVNGMEQRMEEMGMFMTQIMRQQAGQAEHPSKRRKTMDGLTPSFVSSTNSMAFPMETISMDSQGMSNSQPPAMPSRQNMMKQNSIDLIMGDMGGAPPMPMPGGMSNNDRAQSGASFTSTDEAILSTLFADDNKYQDFSVPLQQPVPSTVPVNNNGHDEGEPDPSLVRKLRNALKALPENMQQQLVDRIVTVVTDPAQFQKLVDGVCAAPHHEVEPLNPFSVSPNPSDSEEVNDLQLPLTAL